DVKYFSKFNKNIAQFSDDGEHLYGSYGYRIADYISPIVKKLKMDPASRQIILPILRIEDVIKDTKDIPCTLTFQLLLRDDKLNMIVNMRSNDIIWGLPYDVFSFTNFQQVVANELGVKLGWYCHRPGSFHIYSTHYELFEKISNDFTSKSFTHDYALQEWINIKNNYKDMVDGAANSELFETIHSKVK
ncbi:MAG: hypothetical protein EOL97_15325, partial [Spirochaetia bacterium]|nr:hypothetical protein [Spirochaetia bacterium]